HKKATNTTVGAKFCLRRLLIASLNQSIRCSYVEAEKRSMVYILVYVFPVSVLYLLRI
ncbi:unnamed protein product, partial [Arabidopsis halleri]